MIECGVRSRVDYGVKSRDEVLLGPPNHPLPSSYYVRRIVRSRE